MDVDFKAGIAVVPVPKSLLSFHIIDTFMNYRPDKYIFQRFLLK